MTAQWTAAAASVAAAGGAAWAVRGRSSSVFGDSVWHGPRERRTIALTFDDGPSESTPALLEVLARHGVPATFFQCGANAARLPDVAREVAAAGHEIGNHTQTHARLWLRAPAFVEGEIAQAQETLARIHGATPRLFRAPYGVRWFGVAAAQRRMGLTGVMWSCLGRDWVLPAGPIARRLLSGAANGAILCLHDGRELALRPEIRNTIDSVRAVIPVLLDRGFRFETVSQLLCLNSSNR